MHEAFVRAFVQDPMYRYFFGANEAVCEKCTAAMFHAALDYSTASTLLAVEDDLGVLWFDANYLYFFRGLRFMLPLRQVPDESLRGWRCWADSCCAWNGSDGNEVWKNRP